MKSFWFAFGFSRALRRWCCKSISVCSRIWMFSHGGNIIGDFNYHVTCCLGVQILHLSSVEDWKLGKSRGASICIPYRLKLLWVCWSKQEKKFPRKLLQTSKILSVSAAVKDAAAEFFNNLFPNAYFMSLSKASSARQRGNKFCTLSMSEAIWKIYNFINKKFS